MKRGEREKENLLASEGRGQEINAIGVALERIFVHFEKSD